MSETERSSTYADAETYDENASEAAQDIINAIREDTKYQKAENVAEKAAILQDRCMSFVEALKDTSIEDLERTVQMVKATFANMRHEANERMPEIKGMQFAYCFGRNAVQTELCKQHLVLTGLMNDARTGELPPENVALLMAEQIAKADHLSQTCNFEQKKDDYQPFLTFNDPEIYNHLMLNIYQDTSIKPGIHQNSVTTVGTGGAGLWERSWSRAYAGNIFYNADPNDPENDPMRAMCFASELGRAYIGKIYNQDDEAYRHTTQGMADTSTNARRIIEIIKEADEIEDSKAVTIFAEIKRTGLFEPAAPNKLENFMNQYPDDWYERHQNLMEHAHATHELGQHLAMQGFLNHDPNLIKMGRAAIKRSTQIATYPTGTSSYEPKPAILDQHMENAVSYVKATLSENELDDGPNRETAATFLAELMNSRIRRQAEYTIVFPEQQEEYGERSEEQTRYAQISRRLYTTLDDPLCTRAEQYLADGDAQGTFEHYRLMNDTMQLLANAFYLNSHQSQQEREATGEATRQTAAKMRKIEETGGDVSQMTETLKGLMDNYQITSDEATPAEQQARRLCHTLAAGNIEAAASAIKRENTYVNHSMNVNYHIREAAALITMSRSDQFQQAQQMEQ